MPSEIIPIYFQKTLRKMPCWPYILLGNLLHIYERNLKKPKLNPQTPIPFLLDMAFKVFKNSAVERMSRIQKDKEKDQLMTSALASTLPSQSYPGSGPQGGRLLKTSPNTCYNCHQEEHWSKTCPCLAKRPPPGSCPLCKEEAHYKDCLLSSQKRRSSQLPKGQKGNSSKQLPVLVLVDYEPDYFHLD